MTLLDLVARAMFDTFCRKFRMTTAGTWDRLNPAVRAEWRWDARILLEELERAGLTVRSRK